MEKRLSNGIIVRGEATDVRLLCAKFQIKTEDEYGLTPSESLACFLHGEDRINRYFKWEKNADTEAANGFEKLKGVAVIDVS